MRIFAAYAIVLLHTGAFGKTDITSWHWNVMNVYNSIVRCGVPVFVMISGVLFLDTTRNLDMKKLYCKYILRLVIAFVVWSLFYASVYTLFFHFGKEYFWETFIVGYAHLWFLPMMVCLYVITPLLRKIMDSQSMVRYFLILSVIFTFMVPEILRILNSSMANRINANANFYLTLGYVPYFVAGAYFARQELVPKVRYVIYAIGLIALTLCAILTRHFSANVYCGVFYGSFHPCIMAGSVALFVFGKYFFSKFHPQGRLRNFILSLSGCSFGVYLIHPIVWNTVHQLLKLDSRSFSALWWIPAFAFIVWGISAAGTAVIIRIPLLRKIVL